MSRTMQNYMAMPADIWPPPAFALPDPNGEKMGKFWGVFEILLEHNTLIIKIKHKNKKIRAPWGILSRLLRAISTPGAVLAALPLRSGPRIRPALAKHEVNPDFSYKFAVPKYI